MPLLFSRGSIIPGRRLDGCDREYLLRMLVSANVNDCDNSRIQIEYHSRKLIDSARAALNDPFVYIRYEMKLGGVREISISLGRETLIPVTIPLTAAGFAVATQQRSAIFDRSFVRALRPSQLRHSVVRFRSHPSLHYLRLDLL